MNLVTGEEPNQATDTIWAEAVVNPGRQKALVTIERVMAETDEDMRGILLLRGLQDAARQDEVFQTSYFHTVAAAFAELV